MDRIVVESSDCHAGLPPERYRDFVSPKYRETFDVALPLQLEGVRAMSKKFLDEIFEKKVLELPEAEREPYRKARATPAKAQTPEQRALIRLTAWELKRDAIPVTVIPDSAAAHLMHRREIDCVIVGADRITRHSVFNKIGTYMHAICAGSHEIPFFVAAPTSTFDRVHMGGDIEIEERERDEVAHFAGHATVPDDVPVRNPAFDATPLSLVSALITEEGVIRPASKWFQIAGKHRVI